MANSNNAQFYNKYLTATELNNLSNEQIYKYCFIKGNKEDWTADFNKEILNNLDMYATMKALSGEPLNYIMTKIEYIMEQWIPEGRKLNPKLIFTLQTILNKNKTEVRQASMTGTATEYISRSCSGLTGIINKAFDYTLTNDQQ